MSRPTAITERLVGQVKERLAGDHPVRRNLPVWGRIHVDRKLPFIWVYRQPAGRADPGTTAFLRGEASYLLAHGGRRLHSDLATLVRGVVETLLPEFGAFLVLELWSSRQEPGSSELIASPSFRLWPQQNCGLEGTTRVFERELSKVRVSKLRASVASTPTTRTHAPGFSALLSGKELQAIGASWLGVEIDPIWRRDGGQILFPLIQRILARQFSRSSKHALFEFTRRRTSHRPRHYHTLGRRAVVKAVWDVDLALSEISDSFDFLLQMTPINADDAFRQFQRSSFQREPVLRYRPRLNDPAVLKRRLFQIRMDSIEDPTLAGLFSEKRRELDTQIGILMDRDSPRVLYGSLQLFGGVSDSLDTLSMDLLTRIPARAREDRGSQRVTASEFARRADSEIDHYRQQSPEIRSTVEIRSDIVGLMVSRGNLLVGERAQFAASRVEALLQHEVGTHVLTYINGTLQPLRQLHSGLAGYEELQEGLAVLAEYLAGGLSRPRLRLLAARVVAARAAVDGADFVDTFRLLNYTYKFQRRTAFNVTLRIFRGGGLVKDAIYLRGLVRLLEHLGNGGELEPLLVGKIGFEHVGMILELQRRRVLQPAALRPRYLESPDAIRRLERVRGGLSVTDLLASK